MKFQNSSIIAQHCKIKQCVTVKFSRPSVFHKFSQIPNLDNNQQLKESVLPSSFHLNASNLWLYQTLFILLLWYYFGSRRPVGLVWSNKETLRASSEDYFELYLHKRSLGSVYQQQHYFTAQNSVVHYGLRPQSELIWVPLFLCSWVPFRILVLVAIYMKNDGRKVDLNMLQDASSPTHPKRCVFPESSPQIFFHIWYLGCKT